MSAAANPELALRPMLPGEEQLLAEICRASIMELTGGEYDEPQQEAWAAFTDDLAAFNKHLKGPVTIIATMGGAPVGFGTLESEDKIGLLYVHPAAARRGAGTLLADALEKLAAGRGSETLNVDASDTAYDFFAKRGYSAEQRNSVCRGEEWLSNTTMKKNLPGSETIQ
ncbi:MAG: GNAT family N-acetyltransferase [Pseudomonadota bacterium]